MKKVLYSMLAIVAIAFKLHAQITVSEGPKFPVVKKVGYHNIIGNDDKGFFVNQQNTEGKGISVTIEKYDNKTLKKIFSVKTKVEETQLSLNFNAAAYSDFYYNGEKVFVFFTAYDKKNETIKCFLQTVSNDGKPSDVVEVSSYKYKFISDLDFWNKKFFKYMFSSDKKLFAIIPLFDESDDYTCSIYNSVDFKSVGKKTIALKYEGAKIEIGNFAIDNSGNLIFTVVFPNYKMQKKKEVRDGINGFGIGIIEANSPTLKISKIDFPPNKVILDYNVSSLTNGDFMLYGVVCDKTEEGGISSIASAASFLKRIEGNTLKTKYEKINNFSDNAKKYLDDLIKHSHFENSQIVEMQGATYFVTQHTIKLISIGSAFGPFILRSNKQIVVSKINDKGELEWDRVIPKFHDCPGVAQHAQKPPRYSGRYNIHVVGDKMYFLFLDSPLNKSLEVNNFTPKEVKAIKATAGSEAIVVKDAPSLVAVSIDANGNSKKQEVLKFDETGSNYVAFDYKAFPEQNKMIIFLENRKAMTQNFGAIIFK